MTPTLDEGYTAMTSTMETLNKAGGPHLIGHGATLPLQHSAALLADEHTTLVWDDDRVNPAIRLRGRDRIVSDFTLLGDEYDAISGLYDLNGNGKPPIGLLMDWDGSPALGTGKYNIERLCIQGFGVGIQAGASDTEENCDETTVRKVFFRNCDTGILFKHTQAMGWYVYDTEFLADSITDSVFCFEGGGDLSAFNTFVPHGCRLLRLNAVGNMFGGNNTGYRFYGIKVDSQAGTDFVLLYSDNTATDYILDADIWVDGLMMPIVSDYNGKVFATITGSSRLTIDKSKIACGLTQAFEWRQEDSRYMPSLTITNTRLTETVSCAKMLKRSTSRGKCRVTFRDNYSSTGSLPNYTAVVTGDL